MSIKSTEASMAADASAKTTAGTGAGPEALADAALLMLGAFIVIFVASMLVSIIRSRKKPKK
jgi:hypothetical protein